MEKLTILTLDHNFLTNIFFVNAMRPAIVSNTLGDNLLTTIQPLRHVVQTSTEIYLSDNPWHCNTELCWLASCRPVKSKPVNTGRLVCSHNPHNLEFQAKFSHAENKDHTRT